MYKIMIVDDEDEVREAIKLKTDWAASGYELVGDFGNGRDALDFALAQRPDVVITDICMPFLDGLELTRCIAEQCSDIKVVIITGYEDFEYARQAIRLKVKDFLLKPINLQEFTDFLLKMKREIDEERKQKEDLNHIRLQLNQSLPILKERFLERLATTRLYPHEIAEKFGMFRLRLPGPSHMALVADLDETAHKETELLRFAAFNIFQEIFEEAGEGLVFQTRDDTIAAFVSGQPDQIVRTSQRLSEHARYSVDKYLKMKVSIGIGRTYSELSQLPQSYREAQAALDYRFLLGTGKVISISDMEYGIRPDSFNYTEWERRMMTAVRTGDASRVSAMIEEWSDEMKRTRSSVEKCCASLHKLLAALMNLTVETGLEESDVFGADPFTRIGALKSLGEAEGWMEETCGQVIDFLSRKRTDVTQSQMMAAVSYIQDHYHKESLSLSEVCGHVYMSVSYFSAQFKLLTGETFVEYLTRVRMEKAKELLAFTALKSYEIASRVGYEDPQYFSVIFKRQTGMSPKEYRTTQKGNALA